MTDYYNDVPFMKEALLQAKLACELGEVPVGAVVVKDGEIIGRGYNRREVDCNALAHAECEAILDACKRVGSWRLTGCTLYVTLEPCPMCAGAILNARIERVVYGASDPNGGCVGSLIQLFALDFCHTPKVTTGVLSKECGEILSAFFGKTRVEKEKP